MSRFSDYPKTMTHPAHAPAVVGEKVTDRRGRVTYGQGIPERFPNVHVENADQEEEARAKGYLAWGETKQAPEGWSEYPVCLIHPEHQDAVPPETHEERSIDGTINRWTTPGTPEKYPHVFVADELEEAKWTEKGWKRPGVVDPYAGADEIASPYVPGAVVSEYPKWVDGVIVQDPRLVIGGIEQYPKWIASHDCAVNSPEEEARLLGHVIEAPKPPVDEIAALKARIAELEAKAVPAVPETADAPTEE